MSAGGTSAAFEISTAWRKHMLRHKEGDFQLCGDKL